MRALRLAAYWWTPLCLLAASPCLAAPPGCETPLVNGHGWFVQGDHVIWGWAQHNGWWRSGQRPNLTRRSTGDPQGDVRPNRTEDLDALTDNMLRYGYPAFEHNYGLWYDRRRDAHDETPRANDHVQPPFLEQPWARSESGRASDGLPKYDLTAFNPWYFERLAEFARLCDQKGTILFHKLYMQHALLEIQPHYVDFPWRPANCVQETGMPNRVPAANVFYDVSNPVRRELHRLYIRKCLDVLSPYRNVVYFLSQEYTGPAEFVAFWLDVIAEWEAETGRSVCAGLSATKDVEEAILAGPARAELVDVLDLRYWWIRSDGSLFAPAGGRELPGRGLERGSKQSQESSLQRIYEKVRGCRERYPDKAIVDALAADRKQSWAFLMAGGSMLVRGDVQYPGGADPPQYVQPADVEQILPAYRFICGKLRTVLPRMVPNGPMDLGERPVWRLAGAGHVLAYAPEGGPIIVEHAGGEDLAARWLDPRTGAVTSARGEQRDGALRFETPAGGDWALWLAPPE